MARSLPLVAALLVAFCASTASADDAKHGKDTKGTTSSKDAPHGAADVPVPMNQCVAAGPQAPRDISKHEGNNKVLFSQTPELAKMHLCNVHFHRFAEHRASAYSIFVEDGEHSGWACQQPPPRHAPRDDHEVYEGCAGVAPGDTIEAHWVYTTCDLTAKGVKPLGGGLQGCMTESCANPQLRVEAQVFLLAENGTVRFNGSAPVTSDEGAVRYTGSTTGPKFSNKHCSPLQVSWSVRPTCTPLNIHDFAKWCATNKYQEKHGHGVRELVTKPELLSPIK
ncbi:MAG: cadmium carbonic anhydrase [Deltaproteobacteria bacterium]|nr:cadmium carbonic anhydrase [Deltaproteobacteria bacterium]